MAPTRQRPAHDADEATALLGWYDLQRGIVLLKTEGLSDEDAHRSVIPTSPLMTVAGILAHLTWVEDLWFREVALGEPGVGRAFPNAKDDGEFRVAGVPLATLRQEYAAACARSDRAIASLGLDGVGSTALHSVGVASIRWIVLHMVEETARHAGHLDLIRELLDGEKGYY